MLQVNGTRAARRVCAAPTVFGTAGNDVPNGNAAANTLSGLAGDDILSGLQGTTASTAGSATTR